MLFLSRTRGAKSAAVHPVKTMDVVFLAEAVEAAFVVGSHTYGRACSMQGKI